MAGALLGLGVATASAQTPGETLEFSLDREAAPPIQYTVLVRGSGSGVYRPRLPGAGALAVQAPGTDVEGTPIRVSAPVLKKLFAAVPMVEGGRCETHNKGIAKTGVKVLRYARPGREGQCTYNYSDDDRVNDATVAFEGIAETLRFGERLQAKLRFDRLGLDTELAGLQEAVTAGRALEVENITPVLKTIVADERVMDRVRREAEQLLQAGASGQAAEGVASSTR